MSDRPNPNVDIDKTFSILEKLGVTTDEGLAAAMLGQQMMAHPVAPAGAA